MERCCHHERRCGDRKRGARVRRGSRTPPGRRALNAWVDARTTFEASWTARTSTQILSPAGVCRDYGLYVGLAGRGSLAACTGVYQGHSTSTPGLRLAGRGGAGCPRPVRVGPWMRAHQLLRGDVECLARGGRWALGIRWSTSRHSKERRDQMRIVRWVAARPCSAAACRDARPMPRDRATWMPCGLGRCRALGGDHRPLRRAHGPVRRGAGPSGVPGADGRPPDSDRLHPR